MLGKRVGQTWLVVVVVLLYVPMVSVVLASLANTRYMQFPHRTWTTSAYADAISAYTTAALHRTSFEIAVVVVLFSVVIATAGARMPF